METETPLKSPKFEIGDKVASVIEPFFLGQVIDVDNRYNGFWRYEITFFVEGEPKTAKLFEFELAPAQETQAGFNNNKD